MPTVARFNGIKIMFYNDEHPPHHFHANYNEHNALIDINPLKISKGYLPKIQERAVIERVKTRLDILMETWDNFQRYKIVKVIK